MLLEGHKTDFSSYTRVIYDRLLTFVIKLLFIVKNEMLWLHL